MKQKLENKDETTLELQNTFSSLQQEVEIKTKKLKKVRNRQHCFVILSGLLVNISKGLFHLVE